MTTQTKNELVRRTYHGYLNLGPVRVPPLPAIIGFRDRDDPTIVWYLTHDTTFTWVAINDDLTVVNVAPSDRNQDIIVYGAFDGPWLDANIQLMVRGGRLGYDYHTIAEQGVTFYGSPPPWTRRKVETRHFKIIKGVAFVVQGNGLSYTPDD